MQKKNNNPPTSTLDAPPMTPLKEVKKTLRAQLKATLRQFDHDWIEKHSHAAAHLLFDTAAFTKARGIMIFLPLPHEIDLCPVALGAWQEQMLVTVPLVSYAQKHMIPVEIHSLDQPMDTDHYGLRTPTNTAPIPVDQIDLVLVPGLGFDREGYRIGRGSGFYDRFLAQPAFNGTACGIGFEPQLLDQVPTASHDIRLDMLVTDQQVIKFGRKSERQAG